MKTSYRPAEYNAPVDTRVTAARQVSLSTRQLREQKHSGSTRWLLWGLVLGLAMLAGWRPTAPARAAFPGANGLIAFFSDRNGANDIYVMNPDGSNPTNLTNNAALDDEPVWSPDGKKIAFTSFRDGNGEVYVMNADGSSQINLTNNAATDTEPTWSPDGTKIAFRSVRDGNYEIYVMNADGSGPTNLTNNTALDSEPSWSPDGTNIVFTSDRDGNYEIYAMNADGSGQINLTNNAANDTYPTWSPDGTQIAFSSNRDGNWEVYVMNADGSGQANLTNNAADDIDPAWSPDGTKIAFVSDRDGNNEIYVMNPNGSGSTRLTSNSAIDYYPDWQPLTPIYMTAETPGTTSDGVTFGTEDILQWDGSNWSLFFDGSAAGLKSGSNAHDINGIHVNAADDIYLTFFQNKIMTADLGQVFGHDVIHYDDSDFSFFFDGSDVGLTTVSEKLDGLHLVEDDSDLPGSGGCTAYLLVSTFGTGKVPAAAGGTLNFQGEDVLGFCATNTGAATAGFWYMVLDGSEAGMPKNATFSLSADVAVQRLYLTTKDTFNVDSATGGHSMVYVYDTDSGEFSGPIFEAPANGLNEKVNGLHVQ